MRYQLLIFDWDGTLMDSEARIVACMEAACKDLELPSRGKTAIRNIIGLGLEEAVRTLFPDQHSVTHRQLVERYRHHFLVADTTPSPLFPGVRSMLEELRERGYWLAIATGKGRAGLEKVLRESGLEELFLATRCASDTASKPNPLMLHQLLDELGMGPEHALMIGDTEYDLQMAQNANVAGVAVTYGVHPRERLLQYAPIACIDSITELRDWLVAPTLSKVGKILTNEEPEPSS